MVRSLPSTNIPMAYFTSRGYVVIPYNPNLNVAGRRVGCLNDGGFILCIKLLEYLGYLGFGTSGIFDICYIKHSMC